MSRSIVQFNANAGVAGIPPTTQPRRLAFSCQITDVGEVTIAAGNVFESSVYASAFLHSFKGLSEQVQTGLVNNDVICVKASITEYVNFNAITDSNSDTLLAKTKLWRLDTLSVTLNEQDAYPTDYPWWRLVKYRQQTVDGKTYCWLEVFHEGDIYWSSPAFVMQDP